MLVVREGKVGGFNSTMVTDEEGSGMEEKA